MSVRITIAAPESTVSFLGPGHAIKMFVAACSHEVSNVADMLDFVALLDGDLITGIRNGLARFDEHNIEDDSGAFESVMASTPPNQLPPFRVFSPDMRDASLDPGRLGLILFNLKSKRIVQIQNHYGEINRADRGRVWVSGEPARRLYRYELSPEWALLP
jgi:hypothetical protein